MALLSLLLCGVVLSLLLLLWFGNHALSGIRGYVHGEAIYSRAQKDAVFALQRYAMTADERDWRRYTEAIAIPLAAGRAWRRLGADEPDLHGARDAFLAAHSHPDEVGPMIWLFPFAMWGREMRQAVAIEGAADGLVRRLDAIAGALRTEVLRPGLHADRSPVLLSEISELNAGLSRLEDTFSDLMGAGTRRVARWVLAVTSCASVLLLGVGAAASTRLLRRMRRREDQFRSIIENTSDLISILDEEGHVLYQSPAIVRMLGYQPEELVGIDGFEQIHPDDRPALAASLEEQIRERPPALRASEYRCRHADGSWRTLASTGAVYEDEDGVRRIIVNSRDITLQRELEARLAQTSRLESVGRLAGGVSHDFNNLLTAILGAAESARIVLPPDSPAQAEIAEIIGATDRAAHLTRQLLAFARRQPVEPVVFDLAQELRNVEPLLRRLLGERTQLSVVVPEEPARIRADRAQIERVVLNLVVNGRDAMPAGGTLRLAVSRRRIDRETAARETAGHRGPFVVLEVEDSGEAMDPEVLERIFEPFFTTKPASQGTGLGLATTYGIVRQSGGFVTASSQRGRGSRFRVYLPESPAESTQAPVRGDEEQPGVLGAALRASPGETLLLVEDEPSVRRALARALHAWGYAVVETANGAEALGWAAHHLEEVDLVVSDVVMPRLSGPTLAKRLRARRSDLPVVFISGHPADEEALAGDSRTTLLQKPIPSEVLVARIRALLDAVPRQRRAAPSGRPAPDVLHAAE